MNNKVSKANKSRTLLRYSITHHYDLIFFQVGDSNQKHRVVLYVANSTRHPYLDVRDTRLSMDLESDG